MQAAIPPYCNRLRLFLLANCPSESRCDRLNRALRDIHVEKLVTKRDFDGSVHNLALKLNWLSKPKYSPNRMKRQPQWSNMDSKK